MGEPGRAGEVCVHRALVSGIGGAGEDPRSLLSPDEIARADRLATARLRARFTAARAFLRLVLARHAGTDARSLAFRTDPGGKPRLDSGGPLRFNLSHSGDMVLVAVARDREVGVDVERIEARRDVEALAAILSPAERSELAALAPEERRVAFFRCWARKEAWLKGVGAGLRVPTRSFTVGAGLAREPRVVEPPQGGSGSVAESVVTGAGAWTVVDLDCGVDYAAAAAAEGRDWVVRVIDGVGYEAGSGP